MSVVKGAVNSQIQLNLGDPSMTLMHRAGLAGLWMTLKQLEQQYPTLAERPGNFTWSLTPRSISLNWEGQDLEVLDWLLKQSFQISDEGLISLTGLNPQSMDIETQVTIHQGITGTFLQHNKFFKSNGKKEQSFKVNKKEIIVEYKRAESYAHQHFSQHLCNEQGQLLKGVIGIAGWLYPGAVARHYAFKEQTQFKETPEQALALLFAPIACQYFVLRSYSPGKRVQYALIIPEVTNLEIYARRCWDLKGCGYKNFYASSLQDAGLRFFTYETTIEIARLNQVKRCQLITFGTVDWSPQQKTRTEIVMVEVTEEVIYNYKISCDYFSENRVIQSRGKNFISTSFVRGFIADNLVRGLPWWYNFSTKINSKDLFKRVTYEREGLYNMIQNGQWDETAQKLFVKACHEALKKTYGKIYSRTKKDEYAQFQRKAERIRAELGRCKNAAAFRQFITDFWARAGRISILEDHWEELLPLTTGMIDWKVARDLALLALASYKPSKKTNTLSPEAEESEE
ncbi:type I-MYXAN CRISPR-associated Cas8a1/Cmx1 [Lyngbya aestuarii]|uniref:type I-MYXAN CRISPR-associated Cas8a1/Cmx1 n=1 Tax=Lyngbya aestuarii TaxID=118322 RepID=UPI00403D8CD2